MVRVIVYCEGVTEEIFVNEVLAPYFYGKEIFLTASQCGSGGVSKYSIIKKDVLSWCKQDENRYVTTMLDYYGFPDKVPWEKSHSNDLEERICHFEKSMYDDLNVSNFIPNLIVHEFEALLFSDVEAFKMAGNTDRVVEALRNIRDSFESPEHINGSFQTSPSHRIRSLIWYYSKPIEGQAIAKEIGINKMREQCRHFDKWLRKIEEL